MRRAHQTVMDGVIDRFFPDDIVPWLLENLMPYGTFWLFAFFTLPSVYIVLKILPETKGKTLEEIESYWLENEGQPTRNAP